MSLKHIGKSHALHEARWGVGVYVLDGPMTLAQIKARYQDSPCPFRPSPGFYFRGNWKARGLESLSDDLEGLVRVGWIRRENNQFVLTEQGRQQVQERMEQARRASTWVTGKLPCLFQPDVASMVVLSVQILLALIKLPAGLLSGSIGLLNNSADALLDLLSSLLVYLGVRFNKERAISILLVVFMLGTGGFTLYQAVQHFLTPYVPRLDWFPFAAAILSALAGLVLWTYQRYVGLRSGLMAFITESVDSRNHVFVALSVTAGLAASLLKFGLLDMLVGLGVSILILWSALGLALDLVRSSADHRPAFTHYGFWLQNAYHHVLEGHLKEVMLYLINRQEVQTKSDLLDCTRRAFDYRNNFWMKLIGLDRQFANDEEIDRSLKALIAGGLISLEKSTIGW